MSPDHWRLFVSYSHRFEDREIRRREVYAGEMARFLRFAESAAPHATFSHPAWKGFYPPTLARRGDVYAMSYAPGRSNTGHVAILATRPRIAGHWSVSYPAWHAFEGKKDTLPRKIASSRVPGSNTYTFYVYHATGSPGKGPGFVRQRFGVMTSRSGVIFATWRDGRKCWDYRPIISIFGRAVDAGQTF